MEEWKTEKGHDINENNSDIRIALVDLLRQPIKEFFSHPVTKTCLRRITNKHKLPFLFIIDEAAYLFQTTYNHSFMWVLDHEIYLGPSDSYGLPEMPTDRFLLMLGTHSGFNHIDGSFSFLDFKAEKDINSPVGFHSKFKSCFDIILTPALFQQKYRS